MLISAKKSILFLGLLIAPYILQAADSTMTMTATVLASPCTLDIEKSTTMIELGDIYVNDMLQDTSATSKRSPEKFFDLSFKDCPLTTSSIVATFSGTDNPDTSNGNSFISDGTAKNVAVQVKPEPVRWDSGSFKNGSTATATVASDHSAVFKLTSAMFSPQGNATPGSVHATVTVSFTYQ